VVAVAWQVVRHQPPLHRRTPAPPPPRRPAAATAAAAKLHRTPKTLAPSATSDPTAVALHSHSSSSSQATKSSRRRHRRQPRIRRRRRHRRELPLPLPVHQAQATNRSRRKYSRSQLRESLDRPEPPRPCSQRSQPQPTSQLGWEAWAAPARGAAGVLLERWWRTPGQEAAAWPVTASRSIRAPCERDPAAGARPGVGFLGCTQRGVKRGEVCRQELVLHVGGKRENV
jgi:hypothetical protein